MPVEQPSAEQVLRQLPEVLIVYDGVCVLCNAAIAFIHRHESARQLKMTPLQSELGRWLQQHFDIDLLADNTILVIHHHKLLVRSDALIAIATRLDRPYKWLSGYRFFPKRLRDGLYEYLARRRYRLFGRYDHCLLANAGIQDRIISKMSELY